MFGTTTRPGFDRPTSVLVAFVALLVTVAVATLAVNAAVAGVGAVVLGVFTLAIGVTLLTAAPFAVVRAMGDLGFE